MWFSSKHDGQGRHAKGTLRFLRKGLPKRREGRPATKKRDHDVSADILFLWVLLAGTLVYIGFFSTFFLIGEPRIMGVSKIPEQMLLASVEQQLSGKYLGIVPKRGFFTVRPRAIEERLRLEYPLLASLDVTRIFPDGMRITAVERTKILLWCSGDQCSLIDEEGRAHDGSRALSPENMPHVLLVTDMSGKPVTLGDKVLDRQYGAFVIRMSELFPERLGLAIESRYMTDSRFADEVRVKTQEGWEAYFGTDIPIGSSLDALALLLDKELPKEKRAMLAYIDLRAENRLYYAFREASGSETGAVISSDASVPEKKADEPKKKKP
ncbi:MAG: FtsQ-type POTRA domain-containing protein [Candidatus Moraniibacteriota bacterium]